MARFLVHFSVCWCLKTICNDFVDHLKPSDRLYSSTDYIPIIIHEQKAYYFSLSYHNLGIPKFVPTPPCVCLCITAVSIISFVRRQACFSPLVFPTVVSSFMLSVSS
ncbi:hypothetical protein B0T09DRAFT_123598 [Sordaria sp. MPI-SDFR-AT-0083]|nr:hypothetical protein B0T09DRAFT_123598 [Sordaria sp. MPI-SDFR-AT-0083]